MATSAMNIVQRLGGPTLTTMVASFFGWRPAAAHGGHLSTLWSAKIRSKPSGSASCITSTCGTMASRSLRKSRSKSVKAMELTPDDIPEKSKAVDIIQRLLSNLATITQGVAELRNHYGTGHGKAAGSKGLSD